MKFGKDFRRFLEQTLPEWRDKFLPYKPLKKLIKHLPPPPPQVEGPPPRAEGPPRPTEGAARPLAAALDAWFAAVLNEQLKKFNDFFVDEEESYVIWLQGLKERIEKIKERKRGTFTSDRKFSEEMLEIRKDFVTIHGKMVLLKNYSSVNFTGLVKILKKYDKRTGGLLSLPFTQHALHQPFFTTKPLTRLVLECEANIEVLFPLEAEVIESHQTEKGETHQTCNPEVSSVQADNIGVYQSIKAAIKIIQRLQKARSTYNEDDGSGVVTTESSASDSSANSQNQEVDQESVHSDD
ncbi:hypothetical protein C4D60_Mb01t28640 [Musa balbisiana]|uniref:SPX domain-containing protein n=1 Tax=Musa balbisiana TaxID=52838 RepID=A0A4S8JRE7_MUSBA|nr:hypothetical protein C4D60_Mb01t28640 [Musa balbisiana]